MTLNGATVYRRKAQQTEILRKTWHQQCPLVISTTPTGIYIAASFLAVDVLALIAHGWLYTIVTHLQHGARQYTHEGDDDIDLRYAPYCTERAYSAFQISQPDLGRKNSRLQ